MLARVKVRTRGSIISYSAGCRMVLFALLGIFAPFLSAAYALSAQRVTIGGLVKPRVIDKHDIRFTRLSVDGESLQSRVQNIVQDDYGFLWFGTTDGLYKYDGYSLKAYRHEPGNPNSLGDDTVMALYKERNGSVWIGSRFGGLDRLDPSQDTFTHYRNKLADPASLASDYVSCIYGDDGGSLWIGTDRGLDRLEPATGTFIHYRHDPRDAASLSGDNVISVYEDRRGNLWVGTTHGLNKLDRATGRCVRFLHDSENPRSISNNYVTSILEDRLGTLWVASSFGSGLSALDVKTGEFKRYSFHAEEPSDQSVTGVQSVYEDRDGTLWLCTIDRGLLKLDRDRKTYIRYTNEPGNPNSLPNDTVYTLFEDAEGEMWVGTQTGLSRCQRGLPSFVEYQHEARNPNSLHEDMIWSVQGDSQGFFWIGDEDGLDRLDPDTGNFTFYEHDPKDPYSLSYNKVAAIREDRSGTLWFGTYGGGLDRFDRATGHFFAYRHNPRDPASLSSDSVLSLLIDRQGTLWVGTQGGGLDRFDSRTGRFTSYFNDPPDLNLSFPVVFEDGAGLLWLGTPDRGLISFDPKTGRVKSYLHNAEDPRSLSSNKVTSIREDSQGRIWIGTKGGLNQLDRSRGTVTIFTTSDGLPDNAIESILEDGHGFLWLGTHNGLSRFNPQSRTFRNYSKSDGLAGNLLNPYGPEGACRAPDTEMIFGSSTGVTVFHPERISENPYLVPVVLTDFLLFNKPVRNQGDSPLSRSIWATHSITLTHRQSIFTLEFAGLSYMAPERNRYRYRLEGLETQWNEVDSGRRNATYSNLHAGNYLFRLQGSNNDGLWNTKGVTLAITVLPPWWATWWFRSIVSLLGIGLIWAIYRSRVKALQLQTTRLEVQVTQRTRELEAAKDTAEKSRNIAERANQAKTIFLANMSHELRTPLNAILGFSDLLRNNSRIPDKERRDLNIINRSGEHLLSLIDDVLDMAKIDAGRIVIENAPFDLSDMVGGVMDLMRVRAEEKGLELSMLQTTESCRFVQGDGEKIRQVLINLVGNAVKYTERGTVSVRVDSRPVEDSQHCKLVIEVQDSGIGIARSEQDRIFEPFIQLGRPSRQTGTGLGLAITKKYVELMGGSIHVESAPRKGSLFRVEIPVAIAQTSDVTGYGSKHGQIIGLEPDQPEYRILIVEDQVENWLLLKELLENVGFQVRVAEEGTTGMEIFLAWRPHLIWMDWRLPGMDGVETTRRIRELEGGSDVRIVLLSAFASAEHEEDAVAAGADDFVRKPFRAEDIFGCIARHLGARYTYQAPASEKASGVIDREDLAALPAELRTQLKDALISLDAERIAEVISLISAQNPDLGRTLSEHAERSAYSPILQAIQSSEAVQT